MHPWVEKNSDTVFYNDFVKYTSESALYILRVESRSKVVALFDDSHHFRI